MYREPMAAEGTSTRSALLRLTNTVDSIYNRVTSPAVFAEDSVLALHQVEARTERMAQYMELTEDRVDRAVDDLSERVESQA